MRYHSLGTAHLTACLASARAVEHSIADSANGRRLPCVISESDILSQENEIVAHHLYQLVDARVYKSSKIKSKILPNVREQCNY